MSLLYSEEALALGRGVVALDASWGWCDGGDATFVGTGDPDDPEDVQISFLEHYLHEVSHAVDFGIEALDAGTSDEVGRRVPDRDCDDREAAEARALAIEWCCWKRLGVGLEWGALVDLGSVQGVEEAQICDALEDPAVEGKAIVVLELLGAAVGRLQC